jgi:phosphoadenosine phosphosulfate reductase
VSLAPETEIMTAQELISWAVSTYGEGFAISTSFQKEGMVLIDLASKTGAPVSVFTLDTGRLPDETYAIIDMVRERYGIAVELVLPEPAEVTAMVQQNGANLFYKDVPSRMLCCEIRKVRPLQRKLAGLKAWAAGLRRGQNETRAGVAKVDMAVTPIKISPLADWTPEQVEQYTAENKVPVHPLYLQGYASIGCGPCTRALRPGETERAGRWWWEDEAHKECGIHFTADGRAKRNVDVLLDRVLMNGDGI